MQESSAALVRQRVDLVDHQQGGQLVFTELLQKLPLVFMNGGRGSTTSMAASTPETASPMDFTMKSPSRVRGR